MVVVPGSTFAEIEFDPFAGINSAKSDLALQIRFSSTVVNHYTSN